MTGYTLGDVSTRRLIGVHKDLVAVVRLAITLTTQDFRVIEGVRTLERQKYLLSTGATETLKSRHLTGHAVDIAPIVNGYFSWDWKYYPPVADAMKAAAKQLNIPIEWGGDWKTFKDGPHWQLPWSSYPS